MTQTLQSIVSALTTLVLALQATVTGLPTGSQLAQVTPTATLSLSPSSYSVSVNNAFAVKVVVNTGGQSAYGADINRLGFNPSILQVVDADSGTTGVQISPGVLMPLTIINKVDNTGGSIQFSQLATPGSTFNGSGNLATITFRAVGTGTANVTFDFTLGSGADTNVAGLGGDLLGSVTNGAFTGVVVDITPPTISAISSLGITQTGATVSWTTNENADTQVEYGLTTAYGNSTTLNTSLITSHSAILSALSAGTQYHYRVKSRDTAGNLAQSSDNVLTTQTTPDTTAPSVPSGVTVTPTSESQIQISWTASTDPTGSGQTVSGVSGYQVFRGTTLLGTTPVTARLDTGLTPGTTYGYQVVAVDVAGNVSAKSTTVSATTPLLSLSVQRRIIIAPEGAPSNQRNVAGTIEFLNPTNGSKVFQVSFITNSAGQYLVDVPSGLLPFVNFRAGIPGYLSKLVSNVNLTTTSIVDVTFPTLLAGDFNEDQMVNSLDFSYMNSKWNLTDALSDINKDGIVNSLDFAYVSNNWLLLGE